MLRSHNHPDRVSQITGVVTFAAGIAMLLLVFSLAYHMFTQPVPGLNLSNPPHGAPPPAASIGVALTSFAEKLLLLALLTLVGSLVASKGVQLLFAAAHGHGPETTVPVTRNGAAAQPAVPTEAAPPEKSAH